MASGESRPSSLLFWLTLGRGVLALALGVLVLAWPETSVHALGNFMGISGS